MNLDEHKGFLALGDGTVLMVPVGDQEAIVVATEDRLKQECKKQKFKILHMVPAKVGAIVLTAMKHEAVYIMDAASYNFLVDAVDWGVEHEGWKMGKLEKQPLDEGWHVYAVTVYKTKGGRAAALKKADAFAEGLLKAGDSTLVVAREPKEPTKA